MKYSDDCKVYRIRYYNVWFYLFAKTEMDEYKINILGERIGMGDSMMMKDIHCWCTRQNIRYPFHFYIWNPIIRSLRTERSLKMCGRTSLGIIRSVRKRQ